MKIRRYFFALLFYNKQSGRFLDVHGDVDHYDFAGALEAAQAYGDKVVRDSKLRHLIVLKPVVTEALLQVD